MIPPLIVNFTWCEGKSRKHEIRFYPFIPKGNVKKTTAKRKKSDKGSYAMFNYIGLGKLPHMTLFPAAKERPGSPHGSFTLFFWGGGRGAEVKYISSGPWRSWAI